MGYLLDGLRTFGIPTDKLEGGGVAEEHETRGKGLVTKWAVVKGIRATLRHTITCLNLMTRRIMERVT